MMKVLVLPYVENFDIAEKEFPNIEFEKSFYKNLLYKYENSKPQVLYKGCDCKDFDLVWLSSYWGTRDLAYALDLYLSKHNVKHTKAERSGSKVLDHMIFALNEIPSPNTCFINTYKIEPYIEQIEETCGYPIIVKDIKGCRGKNTFLARDRTELMEIVRKFDCGIKYMYQQFIPNDYDWGVLVNNGNVVATEKSFPKDGEFRNNACNGAKEMFVDPAECPKSVKKIARDAAKALDLEWCRADIVVDRETNKPYLLEINRYPGITKGTDEVKAVISYVGALASAD